MPKQRARSTGEGASRLLDHDVVPGSLETDVESRQAAQGLFKRLTSLGAPASSAAGRLQLPQAVAVANSERERWHLLHVRGRQLRRPRTVVSAYSAADTNGVEPELEYWRSQSATVPMLSIDFSKTIVLSSITARGLNPSSAMTP